MVKCYDWQHWLCVSIIPAKNLECLTAWSHRLMLRARDVWVHESAQDADFVLHISYCLDLAAEALLVCLKSWYMVPRCSGVSRSGPESGGGSKTFVFGMITSRDHARLLCRLPNPRNTCWVLRWCFMRKLACKSMDLDPGQVTADFATSQWIAKREFITTQPRHRSDRRDTWTCVLGCDQQVLYESQVTVWRV